MSAMQDCNEIAQALLSHRWQFAKTMPDSPHWYTLRREWGNDLLFDWVVGYIRANGYVESYAGRPYMKWNHNGFKYWTMGAPIPETILINRARVSEL